MKIGGEIRQFDSGANRDTDANKNDYEGFLSPLVLKRFGDYMTKHRFLPDGTTRDSDNWQKGIPKDVYMKSLLRHLMDLWNIQRGFKEAATEANPQEALCGIIFNANGLLFELLKDELNERRSNSST